MHVEALFVLCLSSVGDFVDMCKGMVGRDFYSLLSDLLDLTLDLVLLADRLVMGVVCSNLRPRSFQGACCG